LTEKPIRARGWQKRMAGGTGLLRGGLSGGHAWSWRHGAMLNYGDAVAHLHIARRVFDSHQPRFTQLGSVWLPLPHILLIPFVQVYRLVGQRDCRRDSLGACLSGRLRGHLPAGAPLAPSAAAALALAFFAANPNLLYLQTTAMTEPLFLCEMIWIAVWLVEWRASLDADPQSRARRLLWLIAAVLMVAAIFTRYDGWMMALLAWGHRHHACPPRWPALARFWLASAFWWLPRRLRGSSTTRGLRRLALTFCAGLTPPRPSRYAPPCRDSAASGLAQSVGRADLFYESRGDGRSRRAWGNVLLALSLLARLGLAHARRRAFAMGACCCGCRFRSTRTRWPTDRCPSFCPSGGRTPGTTRATEWNCCPPWRWAGFCRAVSDRRGQEFKPPCGQR
jgi:hypothetical protein